MLPTARSEKLTVQELADETLVFDHETGKAHCLNRVAGLVWKHCDGRTSPAELARKMELPEATVELALEQLQRRNLVAGEMKPSSAERSRSRRDALRKLAAAAALIPAIMTVTAPTASAQASCIPTFQSCTPGGTPCCDPIASCAQISINDPFQCLVET